MGDMGVVFSRQGRIPWFDLEAIASKRIVIVGLGALGNELSKDLVLSGFRDLTLVDHDVVELSNLSRSPLFRRGDVGAAKVEVASNALGMLMPGLAVRPIRGDIMEMDEGLLKGADIVFACTDNIEARLHINAQTYPFGVPYIDGGTDGLNGKVQVIVPPNTGCLECTVNSSHQRQLRERFSCTGLRDGDGEPLASEITTTAIVAGIQAREGLKLACGRLDLVAEGLTLYDGDSGALERYEVGVSEGCQLHGLIDGGPAKD